MLKDELKTLLIIPDDENTKLLVAIDEERKEMLSYGLKFLPLNKFCEWFENNFQSNYGKKTSTSGFFVKTNAYEIIKEYEEFKKKILKSNPNVKSSVRK